MARNIRKYGYAPNRFRNTFLDFVVSTAQLHRTTRLRAVRTPDQQRKAIEPMTTGARILAYYRQNGTPRRPLTASQQRRIRKHAHKHLTPA